MTRQHDNGARVLGVCSGSLVLAATGMLDGLDATSHWSRISALEKSRPEVNWLRGRRYIEDGTVECELHAAKFDIKTGAAVSAPATAPVVSYPVAVVDGTIYVDLRGRQGCIVEQLSF